MSRLGKQPVALPQGVEASFSSGVLTVKGPKGTLTRSMHDDIKVTVTPEGIVFEKAKENDAAKKLWGTYAAYARNMVEGVTTGFKKELDVEGVGYRAEAQGNKIKLSVGFSHPVEIVAPEGITLAVEKGHITISGSDKEAVGQFAANVRKVKKPEPYKGKGVRYTGEYIIRKQGKKGVA